MTNILFNITVTNDKIYLLIKNYLKIMRPYDESGMTLKQKVSYFEQTAKSCSDNKDLSAQAKHLFCYIPTIGTNHVSDMLTCLKIWCDIDKIRTIESMYDCIDAIIKLDFSIFGSMRRKEALTYLGILNAPVDMVIYMMLKKSFLEIDKEKVLVILGWAVWTSLIYFFGYNEKNQDICSIGSLIILSVFVWIWVWKHCRKNLIKLEADKYLKERLHRYFRKGYTDKEGYELGFEVKPVSFSGDRDRNIYGAQAINIICTLEVTPPGQTVLYIFDKGPYVCKHAKEIANRIKCSDKWQDSFGFRFKYETVSTGEYYQNFLVDAKDYFGNPLVSDDTQKSPGHNTEIIKWEQQSGLKEGLTLAEKSSFYEAVFPLYKDCEHLMNTLLYDVPTIRATPKEISEAFKKLKEEARWHRGGFSNYDFIVLRRNGEHWMF